MCNRSASKNFVTGIVNANDIVDHQEGIATLRIFVTKQAILRSLSTTDAAQIENVHMSTPMAGQFYMLRTRNFSRLLSRPISVYDCYETESGVMLSFIIARRGQGTEELLRLDRYDFVELLGPLGNEFPLPQADARVCLVSGGVGVAPIAMLARNLEAIQHDYDLYAGFKRMRFGLDSEHNLLRLRVMHTVSEMDDFNPCGRIDDILTASVLKREQYDAVYACGPEPMLAYVQKICREAGVRMWLSMESRMACGVGACLGCTIYTTQGNKRCCADGPVFDGEILQFDTPAICTRSGDQDANEAGSERDFTPDLSVEIAGVQFKNPIIAASGTFGFGTEYEDVAGVERLGGICSKGLTLEARTGNTGTRIFETRQGLMNSIGLENPGVQEFIDCKLSEMLTKRPVVIVNLSGSTVDDYVSGAKLLDQSDVRMIELNISCPNVKAGGMGFGMKPGAAAEVVAAVRAATRKPLMVKLTPNAHDLVAVAMAVREAGADALSLVNTFQAMAVDIETGQPIFNNVRAGLSGPAIKPIALRMVYDVVQAMRQLPEKLQIPVVGLGGITTWQDAVEFLLAGATAVQVGTATFANPQAMSQMIDGVREYMQRKRFANLMELAGSAQF